MQFEESVSTLNTFLEDYALDRCSRHGVIWKKCHIITAASKEGDTKWPHHYEIDEKTFAVRQHIIGGVWTPAMYMTTNDFGPLCSQIFYTF